MSLLLDPALGATCVGANVAILVGILVFLAVAQLVREQSKSAFSLEVARERSRSRLLAKLATISVVASAGSSVIGLASMVVPIELLLLLTLSTTIVSIASFAALSLLTISWFWTSRNR